MSSLLSPAGIPLTEHLPPGQALRAGSTVTHAGFSEQRLAATAVLVEILDSSQGELNNGLTLPLAELQPVKTDERWVKMEGASVPYLLSDQGKVVSLRYARKLRERLLHASLFGRYPCVSLKLDDRTKHYHIARLVARNFLPPPAEARLNHVLHLDQNPLNSHFANLRWVDKEESEDVTIADLLRRRGRHHLAKMTQEQVEQARQRHAQGEKFTDIAREFSISSARLAFLVHNRPQRIPSPAGPENKSPLPATSASRRTPAGIPLVDYLLPGEPLRAGATVTHPRWARKGQRATAVVVEMHTDGSVTLTNGLRLPASELERMETPEQWVYIQGVANQLLLSDQGKVVKPQYYGRPRERLLLIRLRKGQLNIVLSQQQQQVNRRVADLVAQHFLPPPPTSTMNYALALDGDPLHIAATNLQWAVNPVAPWKVPPKPRALSDEQAAEILSLHRQGQRIKQLAQTFGVSDTTIGRITNGGRAAHQKS